MLRFLLIRFWPVLIPLALYFLWFAYKRWRYRTTGEKIYLRDGPWLMITSSMLIIAALMFFGMRILSPHTGPAIYEPAIMGADGKVIQGEIEPKNAP